MIVKTADMLFRPGDGLEEKKLTATDENCSNNCYDPELWVPYPDLENPNPDPAALDPALQ